MTSLSPMTEKTLGERLNAFVIEFKKHWANPGAGGYVRMNGAFLQRAGETFSEAAAQLTAKEAERGRIALAICGGEDAPGHADSLPLDQLLAVLADNYATARRDAELAWDGETATSWKSRAKAAEADRDRLLEVVKPYHDLFVQIIADHGDDWLPDDASALRASLSYPAAKMPIRGSHFRQAAQAYSEIKGEEADG